jgi:hypothetical protein
MPQTYLDEESLQILKGIKEEMRKAGMKGATYGDAVRRLKQGYDEKMRTISSSPT